MCRLFFASLSVVCATFFATLPTVSAEEHEHDHDWMFEEVEPTPQPPDGREESSPAPERFVKGATTNSLVGPITPAAGQPVGSLSGRIVYMSCGHGWTYGTSSGGQYWRLQRGTTQSMNEDYGNLDQLNLFAMYCFNAGATVVPYRPLGRQTNEVVLDNVSSGVTFAGTWNNTTATSHFYGTAGQIGYRYASLSSNVETATATYTPNIPVAGFYPVYTWVRHGSDRGLQLYRIRHTGGEAQVRVPHHMVGNGWVFLGEYHFNAGANAAVGSVVISNLRGSANGSVVIADAIRFGNGMGSIDRGGGVSGYPREEECTRYWAHAGIGVGMSSSLYDSGSHDESDSWSTPAKMSAEMNLGPTSSAGLDYKRVHISFHSNAGGGRGVVGLITGDPTPNQSRLAKICGDEVNADMVGLASSLEVSWQNRTTTTYTGGYGEIDGSSFNYEMDATIIEVGFHDDVDDAKIMRDPKGRNAVARAAYHSVVKYMNEFDTAAPPPLTFLPEPPNNPRAIGSTNGITLSWTAPVNQSGSSSATNYIIYTSTNGYGFGNPVSVGNVLTYTFTNLPADTAWYFRIVAANAGGQSFPAEIVGCRRSSVPNAPKALFVNAYARFDRTQNLLQSTGAENYKPAGNSGTIERVNPRSNNSFDYVVQHGQSLSAANMAFDSCLRLAVSNNTVNLLNYPVVIWAAGQELVNTIDSSSQSKLSTFLQNDGGLFVSGSEIAGNLGRASSPAASRAFMQNQLHATLASDAHTNSGSYTVTAAGSAIFSGIGNSTIDNGTRGIYWVKTPDVLTPSGVGAKAALNYSGGLGGASAIQYDGSAGGGRVVFFGFPFETISSAARRDSYMAEIIEFLSVPPPAGSPTITADPLSQNVNRYSDVTFTVAATGQAPLYFQWRFNGTNIVNETNNTLTLLNVQTNQAGQYSVFVSNSINSSLSSPATLNVLIPTVTQTFFADNFDTNSASQWTVNASSADTRVTFHYNYATNGIASAPNSTGGTQRGVKFEANMTLSNVAAICISPTGKSFTGDYDLKFDMWINANGPFPGGGRGSSQHVTAGVGTTGTKVQWGSAGTTADGTWFAVDGEGQAGNGTVSDFAAYITTTQQTTNSGVYAAGTAGNARQSTHPYYAGTFPQGQTAPASQNQTGQLAAGAVGFKWRNVLVRKTGTKVDWFIDNLRIATINTGTFSGNNIFVGYWDPFTSMSDNLQLSFGLIDNIRVERTTEAVFPAITAHPQDKTVVEGTNVTFTVSATGTTNLYYQWKFEEEVIAGATASSYTVTNAQPMHEGQYSVTVSNIAGKVTSSNAVLAVIVPPSIVEPPQGQTVTRGGNVTFNVEASGSEPLAYQWNFNGGIIAGATESSLTFTNVQGTNAGNYFVTITNAAGATNSIPVALIVNATLAHFETLLLNEEGRPQIVLTGEPGTTYSIQISTNLIHWETLTNVVFSAEDTVEWIDTPATNDTRFYRTVSTP